MWTYYRADPARVEEAWARVGDLLRAGIADVPAMAPEWQRRQSLNRAQCRIAVEEK